MRCGKMGVPAPPELCKRVQREADIELLWRILAGIVVYLLAIVSLGMTTAWRVEHPRLFWTVSLCVGISMAIRGAVFVFRKRLYSHGRRWILAPTLMALVMGSGAMGIAYLAILWFYGLSAWTFMIMTMWMLGIASGSTISFTPNFALFLVQTSLLLGPVMLYDPLVHPEHSLSYGIGVWVFFAFHAFQGRRVHRLYMGLLMDRSRERQRAEELEAAKLAAERAEQELRYQATHDTLTGMMNRGEILSMLEKEFARAMRSGSSLGVVMFDLDHFKEVNDRQGHLAGDEVLRCMAARVLCAIRQYDAVGRYGGEEFLLVLPGCNREESVASAERIRSEIAAAPVQLSSGGQTMTASFGATVIRPERDTAVNQLIARADRALYTAKRNGRNRVEFRVDGPQPSHVPGGGGSIGGLLSGTMFLRLP